MAKLKLVVTILTGFLLTISSGVPTNNKEDKEELNDFSSSSTHSTSHLTFPFTPLTGSPPLDPPSDSSSLNVSSYSPPVVSLTSILANMTKGGPRANLNWITHLIPGSNAGISMLDVRVLINLLTFVLSTFSMARFAFQVVNALLGIFSATRTRNTRELPPDFLAKLFEPPVSPLSYNVTENAGDAILEHFRLLYVEPEACRMKTICEVMKEPNAANGILGELVASTFGEGKSDTVAAAIIGKERFKGYYTAAQLGRKQYDCSKAFSECPKSYRDFLLSANG